MRAVDQCAGGRRYITDRPCDRRDRRDGVNPPRRGADCSSAPSAQASMAAGTTSGLLAPRVPGCRPRLRAAGRLAGLPGARGWRGPGALHVRHPPSGPN